MQHMNATEATAQATTHPVVTDERRAKLLANLAKAQEARKLKAEQRKKALEDAKASTKTVTVTAPEFPHEESSTDDSDTSDSEAGDVARPPPAAAAPRPARSDDFTRYKEKMKRRYATRYELLTRAHMAAAPCRSTDTQQQHQEAPQQQDAPPTGSKLKRALAHDVVQAQLQKDLLASTLVKLFGTS
jgi:hypothetical protein